MKQREILRVQNVSKCFGSTQALIDINLTLNYGGIYSLVGKNGAGKTTLVNIIAGIYKADTGSVVFEGINVTAKNLEQRQKDGIRIVTQHASVIPDMTVAENIAVGFWPLTRRGTIDWKALYAQAGVVLEEYGVHVAPETPMHKLDPIAQRKINIIRALFGGGKLIILDEPTTSLSSIDRDVLFEFVRGLAARGITFIFISHYLDEVMKLSSADFIKVIRDGRIIPLDENENVNEIYLANLLAGENVVLATRDHHIAQAFDIAISCEQLCTSTLKGVNLQVRQGEIVGLIGFPSSGAQELCRTLYGLERIHRGCVKRDGKIISLSCATDALKHKIVYIPHDRHKEGIIPKHSIEDNICLPVLRKLRNRYGVLDRAKQRALAGSTKAMLDIKADSIDDLLNSLSGGNQQKVVVAKAIVCQPTCLILDEPTIGIDIKSREEILSRINDLTKTGMCALYYTNDFDELARMCDRLVFFQDGRIVREVNNGGKSLKSSDIIEIRDQREKVVGES